MSSARLAIRLPGPHAWHPPSQHKFSVPVFQNLPYPTSVLDGLFLRPYFPPSALPPPAAPLRPPSPCETTLATSCSLAIPPEPSRTIPSLTHAFTHQKRLVLHSLLSLPPRSPSPNPTVTLTLALAVSQALPLTLTPTQLCYRRGRLSTLRLSRSAATATRETGAGIVTMTRPVAVEAVASEVAAAASEVVAAVSEVAAAVQETSVE